MLFHYGSLPVRAGARSLTVTGEPVCRRLMGALSQDDLPTNAGLLLYPTTSAVLFGDYGIVFDFAPAGVGHTQVRCQWLVDGNAQEGRDYEVDDVVALWDITNRQDWALCELVQQGVRSRRYVPGPIALTREPGIREFLDSYAVMIERGRPPA
jgi:Rieske 2Fe-2S family protein